MRASSRIQAPKASTLLGAGRCLTHARECPTLPACVARSFRRPSSLGSATQGTRKGSPEESLPQNIIRLTHFGERASWSPDGKRIAFMEKSFGDAFEVDVSTKAIRLLTHYPHAGFLRVQFLPNGDYFLIGARTFTDIRRRGRAIRRCGS